MNALMADGSILFSRIHHLFPYRRDVYGERHVPNFLEAVLGDIRQVHGSFPKVTDYHQTNHREWLPQYISYPFKSSLCLEYTTAFI